MTPGPMDRALELAREARGSTSPNPPVGAVLVKDGVVVGEGATQLVGMAHAEIVALEAAKGEARDSTLYVTLEPCSHWGRTPPCAEALIAAGIRSVHMAMMDPNPRVNGAGIRLLQAHGIEVHVGEGAHASAEILEAFLTSVALGRPFITVALAPTASALTQLAHEADITVLPAVHDSIPLQDKPVYRVSAPPGGPGSELVLMSGLRERPADLPPFPPTFAAPDEHDLMQALGRLQLRECLIIGDSPLTGALIRKKLVDKIVAGAEVLIPTGFAPRRHQDSRSSDLVLYPQNE